MWFRRLIWQDATGSRSLELLLLALGAPSGMAELRGDEPRWWSRCSLSYQVQSSSLPPDWTLPRRDGSE